jgi:pantothenate kinase-related protein Tda10
MNKKDIKKLTEKLDVLYTIDFVQIIIEKILDSLKKDKIINISGNVATGKSYLAGILKSHVKKLKINDFSGFVEKTDYSIHIRKKDWLNS